MDRYKDYLIKVGIVWAVCFGLFAAVYLFALGPQLKAKSRTTQQFKETMEAYNTAQQMAREETKIKLRERIEQLGADLNKYMVDNSSTANLVFDISNIANETELEGFSIGVREKITGRDSLQCNYIDESQINVSFRVKDFYQFATFLNRLERNEPVVFVDKFEISRSRNSSTGHQVSMNLSAFIRKKAES